jgi:hypothetical protein
MLRRRSMALAVAAVVLAALQPSRADESSQLQTKTLTDNEAKIKRALSEKAEFRITEKSLSDVMKTVGARLHIEIQFDMKALNDANPKIDPVQTLISRDVKDITLASALKLILQDYNLTYLIKDEVLMITSKDEADKSMLVEFYDVRDLVYHAKDTADPGVFEQLHDIIRETVGPPTIWQDTNPDGGAIHDFNNSDICVLVIYQTQEKHEEIAELLANLRKYKH